MNDAEKEAQTPERATRKPMKSLWRVLNVAALGMLIAAGYSGYRFYRVGLAPIDVKKATKTEAISWLALRDLSQESSETRSELVNFYLEKFSDDEEIKEENQKNSQKFVLSPKLKNIANTLLLDSDNETIRWDEERERPSYFRIDYVVKRDSNSDSIYVLTTDVKPTASLLARRQEAIDAAKNKNRKLSKFEKNLSLIHI